MTEPRSSPPDLSELRISADQRRRRPTRWPWVALVLGLAVVVWGTRGAWQGWLDAWTLPEVVVASVRRVAAGTGSGSLTANGYVVAQRQSALAPKQTGRLVELNVVEGSRVAEDEVVGRLEKNDLDAQLERARAEVAAASAERDGAQSRAEQAAEERAESAELTSAAQASQRDAEAARLDADRERKRQQELVAKGFASQRDLDQAETTFSRAEARFEETEARVRSARKRESAVELGERLATSAVATAQAILEARRADVSLMEAQIEYTIIRAPFAGVVIQKNAEIGEIVAPVSAGAQARVAVVTIVDMSSLMVEAEVNESYIRRVRIDQPVRIVLDAFPDVVYRGRVFKVVPTANRQKASVEVKVSFDALDDRILPEMGARVSFFEEEEAEASAEDAAPRLLVTAAALSGSESARFVWVVSDEGRLTRRPVEVREQPGGEAEIVSGLSAGERVVVSPAADLEDGATVRIAASPR